ncbi:MAG: fucose isomerase [Chitinophagaceae bacterium]|nr:fucose isomerase [Chitinophagaceae bacterium]
MKATSKSTIGVIIGNRDFFPDKLVAEARVEILDLCTSLNINPILLSDADSKLGGVETFFEAQKCASLFKKHAHEIEGILVLLPNFGDEKGVADAIQLSGLKVPVLVQAYPDDLDKMDVVNRRDAWCGKISVCNNLYQYGIKYTLTTKHVVSLKDASFINDLKTFTAVCRVVNGLRKVRIGAVGARPTAFNTVRYSEKLLQRNGISVTTVDLSEILGNANKLTADDAAVKEKLEKIHAYTNVGLTPPDKLVQIAKLDVVLANFMAENALDVTGTLSMYAMQLASGSPSALVDWNNNYANDDSKCVLFHCGNWAKSFLPDITISTAPILGTSVGTENTYGALDGRTPAMPLTFGRISTDDCKGIIKAYVGEGELTNDALNTFGNRAVAQINNLNGLMNYVCRNGFEHHVVMNASKTAGILKEAFENYLGWETYEHI